jgi:hypothetical protein
MSVVFHVVWKCGLRLSASSAHAKATRGRKTG